MIIPPLAATTSGASGIVVSRATAFLHAGDGEKPLLLVSDVVRRLFSNNACSWSRDLAPNPVFDKRRGVIELKASTLSMAGGPVIQITRLKNHG